MFTIIVSASPKRNLHNPWMYSSKFTTNDTGNSSISVECNASVCVCPSTAKWCRRPSSATMTCSPWILIVFKRRCLITERRIWTGIDRAGTFFTLKSCHANARIHNLLHQIRTYWLGISWFCIILVAHSCMSSPLPQFLFLREEKRLRRPKMCSSHLFENYPLSSNKQIVLSHAPSSASHRIVKLCSRPIIRTARGERHQHIIDTHEFPRIAILCTVSTRRHSANDTIPNWCGRDALFLHLAFVLFFGRNYTNRSNMVWWIADRAVCVSIAAIHTATHNAHVNTTNYCACMGSYSMLHSSTHTPTHTSIALFEQRRKQISEFAKPFSVPSKWESTLYTP